MLGLDIRDSMNIMLPSERVREPQTIRGFKIKKLHSSNKTVVNVENERSNCFQVGKEVGNIVYSFR